MVKRREFCIPYNEKIEEYIRKGEYLGSGHNGIVYLLPHNRVIKVFNDPIICRREYNILKKTIHSKHFPKVYDAGDNFIVRDMIYGKRLDKYLKKHNMTKSLADKIVELIEEFKKLKFTKLDIRCKDIFICYDGNLMVIDPKNNYTKNVQYPRHLMKGLNKLMVLDDFLYFVRKKNKKIHKFWDYRIKRYLQKNIK